MFHKNTEELANLNYLKNKNLFINLLENFKNELEEYQKCMDEKTDSNRREATSFILNKIDQCSSTQEIYEYTITPKFQALIGNSSLPFRKHLCGIVLEFKENFEKIKLNISRKNIHEILVSSIKLSVDDYKLLFLYAPFFVTNHIKQHKNYLDNDIRFANTFLWEFIKDPDSLEKINFERKKLKMPVISSNKNSNHLFNKKDPNHAVKLTFYVTLEQQLYLYFSYFNSDKYNFDTDTDYMKLLVKECSEIFNEYTIEEQRTVQNALKKIIKDFLSKFHMFTAEKHIWDYLIENFKYLENENLKEISLHTVNQLSLKIAKTNSFIAGEINYICRKKPDKIVKLIKKIYEYNVLKLSKKILKQIIKSHEADSIGKLINYINITDLTITEEAKDKLSPERISFAIPLGEAIIQSVKSEFKKWCVSKLTHAIDKIYIQGFNDAGLSDELIKLGIIELHSKSNLINVDIRQLKSNLLLEATLDDQILNKIKTHISVDTIFKKCYQSYVIAALNKKLAQFYLEIYSFQKEKYSSFAINHAQFNTYIFIKSLLNALIKSEYCSKNFREIFSSDSDDINSLKKYCISRLEMDNKYFLNEYIQFLDCQENIIKCNNLLKIIAKYDIPNNFKVKLNRIMGSYVLQNIGFVLTSLKSIDFTKLQNSIDKYFSLFKDFLFELFSYYSINQNNSLAVYSVIHSLMLSFFNVSSNSEISNGQNQLRLRNTINSKLLNLTKFDEFNDTSSSTLSVAGVLKLPNSKNQPLTWRLIANCISYWHENYDKKYDNINGFKSNLVEKLNYFLKQRAADNFDDEVSDEIMKKLFFSIIGAYSEKNELFLEPAEKLNQAIRRTLCSTSTWCAYNLNRNDATKLYFSEFTLVFKPKKRVSNAKDKKSNSDEIQLSSFTLDEDYVESVETSHQNIPAQINTTSLKFFAEINLNHLQKLLMSMQRIHGTNDFALSNDEILDLKNRLEERWEKFKGNNNPYITNGWPIFPNNQSYIEAAIVLSNYYRTHTKESTSILDLLIGIEFEKNCPSFNGEKPKHIDTIPFKNLILLKNYACDITWFIDQCKQNQLIVNPYTNIELSKKEINAICMHEQSAELFKLTLNIRETPHAQYIYEFFKSREQPPIRPFLLG